MNKQTTTTLVILIATTFIIVGAVVMKNGRDATSQVSSEGDAIQSSVTQKKNTQSASPSGSDAASDYKDGTYTAIGDYESPDGEQTISVTLSIKNGTVTDTSAINQAEGRESKEYADRFISGYKSQIIGKKLSDLEGSVSAGASLTLNGFNDAVTDIQQQAKV
jgi:uncharacterized protein with FMN-binding domain